MKAISLFSGAGGDSLGMTMAGVDVVGFVELDDTAAATHSLNLPHSKRIGSDIMRLSDDELLSFRGKIDIIFCGFPCQGYSHAGKKKMDDPRNNLYLEFIRTARVIQPTWIVGENVKRMARVQDIANQIVRGFEKIGYTVVGPTIIKCVRHGVPQKRERCFFVGRLGGANPFSFDALPVIDPPPPLLPLIEDTLEGAIGVDHQRYGVMGARPVSPGVIPTGKPATNLLKCSAAGTLSFGRRSGSTHSEILDLTKQAKTIICTYARMPRQFVPLCDVNGAHYIRQLTVKELQQVQGFPDSYAFLGDRSDQIRQIGNAVPPPVARLIVDQVVRLSRKKK